MHSKNCYAIYYELFIWTSRIGFQRHHKFLSKRGSWKNVNKHKIRLSTHNVIANMNINKFILTILIWHVELLLLKRSIFFLYHTINIKMNDQNNQILMITWNCEFQFYLRIHMTKSKYFSYEYGPRASCANTHRINPRWIRF